MTHRWAPSGIQGWLLSAAAAALVGCDNDPVERELVGTWQAAVVAATGAVQLRFTTLSNGQYRIDQTGVVALQTETGYFAATDGEWRKENITGGIEQGTYEFLSDDSVLFQSAASGAVVWRRVAETTPTAPPDATASPQPTAAPLAPATPLTGGVPLLVTQDVLATGPFGPAMAPSAPSAFPQPNGVPSTQTDFGAPQNGIPAAAAPFGAPTNGAAGAPQFAPPAANTPSAAGTTFSPSGFPGQTAPNTISAGTRAVTNLDTGALADLPQQTLNDFEGAARQAAAGVVDQAAAPIAEAADEAERKVGERIRNFFRRDRQRDEQEAEEQ